MAADIQKIDIVGDDGRPTAYSFKLFSPSAADYVLIGEDDAKKYSEARDQIIEGAEYAYEFDDPCLTLERHAVISPSMTHPNEGRIRTGNYVGRLWLKVRKGDDVVGHLDLQVRSRKIAFRDHYHKMLEDIAREAAELVMSSGEATYQKYEVDPSKAKRMRYEQFAFVRSLLQSDAFQAAMGRICNSPIAAMKDVVEERRTNSLRRMSRNAVLQLVSASNRELLPNGHPLSAKLSHLPRYVSVCSREETVDVPENRFVKFVLTAFRNFAEDIAKLSGEDTRLHESAKYLADSIDNYLLEPIFREVSTLDRMVESPALQRREGYREILRTWLMFSMAAKIGWEGGEDVYGAGNRNIAVLYEYWAFFELLRIVASVFGIERKEREKLLVKSKDGLELALGRGKKVMLKGVYEPAGCKRPLEVRFHYNKTFAADDNFEKSGSWTVDMRPDYTLSLWPKGLSEAEAEKADAIVHVHFDAKYRIENFRDVFERDPKARANGQGENDADVQRHLNQVHADEDEGNYKRGDLLKMHSYNDSIRRTYGSYILYPGQGEDEIHRYREIIPGIGAFVMRPSLETNESVGSVALKLFLQKIALSLQDRLAQHERMAKYHNLVHRDAPTPMTIQAMELRLPEENSYYRRQFIPAEEYVIVGFYKDAEHLQWILKNYYNFRMGAVNGSVRLTRGMTDAEYILLHGPGEVQKADKMYRIVREQSDRVWAKNDFEGKKYPGGLPSGEHYIMYKLEAIQRGEPMYGGVYDVTQLAGYSTGRGSAKPFDTTFADLLQHVVAVNN